MPSKPLSVGEYENYQKHMDTRTTEYDRLYSSSSIAGQIGGPPLGPPPGKAGYNYPDVNNMAEVRQSLDGGVPVNSSIWAAARRTSQSLDFDQRSAASSTGSQPRRRPPPPPGAPSADKQYQDQARRYSQSQPPPGPYPSQYAPQMAPQQSNQNVLALERRLAQLEAENAKLKQVKQNLVKKKEKEDRRPPRVQTGRDDDYDDEDFGSGVGDIRKSVEKGLSALANIEKKRQAELNEALETLKAKQKEVMDLKKSSDKANRELKKVARVLEDPPPRPPKRSTSPKKKRGSGGATPKSTKSSPEPSPAEPEPLDSDAPFYERLSRRPPPSPTKSRSSGSPKRSPKRSFSPSKYSPPPPLKQPIVHTRATQLRLAKREAEKKAWESGEVDSEDEDYEGGFSEKKEQSRTFGPRPTNPSNFQRVQRQRVAGTDPEDIIVRKSRDYERKISANKVTPDFTVEQGKPLDWAVLMGTNERKNMMRSGALKKEDPSYGEVQGIASHCRGKDKPPPEIIAIMGDTIPPPKQPEDEKEHDFKKKISKLFVGLKQILENNAERQVKYVSFKQRCNMHTNDLATILARKALATMAYAHGAHNSPHLDGKSWSDFLRAFWGENPHRFPITETEVMHMWQICDAGDTALFGEMVYVQPYVERNVFGFEFTQNCWGKPREGFMRIRSAGFEQMISEDEIPAKVNYGYCDTTVSPPMDWDVNDIKRGTEVPKSQLELERVYGCLGKTICPNLYESHDGKVIFTAAAVAVVQDVESGAQRFYNNHCDDITVLTVHYAGRIAATGQMGKPCYALVWDVDTCETMYRIGDGYFERMVEALAISPNCRYLVGVGGDNNQSMAVFDLKAVDEQGEPCPAMICEDQFTPGVPPMLTFLEWKPGTSGVTFVGIAKGKLLRFFDFEPDKEGADNPESGVQMLTSRKGMSPREVRELPCAAWAMDGSCLLTGTDTGDVLIWTGTAITATIKAYGAVGKNPVRVTCLAPTPENNKLYTGGSDGKLKVWSYPEGKLLDTHHMALSRAELASKCGGAEAAEKPKKKKEKAVPGAPKGPEGKKEKIIPANKSIMNIIVLDNKKVVKEGEGGLLPGEYEQVVIGNERGMLLNVWDDSNGDTQFKSMMASHYGEVSGLGSHPFKKGIFATVGEDGILNIWDALNKVILKTAELPHPARNVCFSPGGEWIGIGYCDGYMGVYDSDKLKERVEHHTLTEDIDAIKFSPNGRWLAAGSHDNYIDLFDAEKGFKFKHRFKGHTSFITHIDWSVDSRMLSSNCAASEILYWDVVNRRQLRAKADMPNDPNDPKTWGRMTNIMGFPVMGIWPDFSDGTDVNALHVNEKGDIVVTCDDFGEVKLFNFPCVTEDAAFRAYRGHSSFVNNCSFVCGDSHIISCGSADLTVMQWKFIYDVDKLQPIKNAFKKMSVANAFGMAKSKGWKTTAADVAVAEKRLEEVVEHEEEMEKIRAQSMGGGITSGLVEELKEAQGTTEVGGGRGVGGVVQQQEEEEEVVVVQEEKTEEEKQAIL
ncbi:hypothetical protein TrLO_g6248 [Triparma laevis f. longispina]|uniref:EML-like second beta-propeller domain-containing protein n=1 Tax=Triparma laevis f. longispina TaxID=1714387 RepID=A0A9W7EHX0_9STRA|nr:hypothetical protein TrLO_g6248 [Triparma laevis f. longispina]